MTDADLLEELGVGTADGLRGLLEAAPLTHSRVTAASSDWSRHRPSIRPAHTSRLTAVTGANWLAVGDAAITYDPLPPTAWSPPWAKGSTPPQPWSSTSRAGPTQCPTTPG